MTNLTNIKIPNDSILVDFKEHLDLENNDRILFTAPFGAGKSTFIDDFKNYYSEDYRLVRLYPVNYAVSANEDIFELIKFDILYELMAHYQEEIELQEEDFKFWLRMSMFMQNKADLMPLFLHIISLHETIGKPIAKFIEVIKPLVKDFETYTEEVNIDEAGDFFSFLESFENKKGNQYEMDATSQFIYDLVDRLKDATLPDQEEIQEEDKKRVNKTVLVIDDLDRLDPDHIFRLFNIFSAHTHSISGENKFGFDKVIFVCDIENVRKIYAHKYGRGVDFSGYMDKFYSRKPFDFDNIKYLNEKLVEIIKSSTFTNSAQLELVQRDPLVYSLSAILKILSKNKVINLRSVLKNTTFLLTTDGFVKIKDNIVLHKKSLSLFSAFEIVSQMLGGWKNLERALVILKDTIYNKNYIEHNQKFIDKFSLVDTDYGHELEFLRLEVFRVFIAENLKNTNQTSNNDLIITLHEFNLDVIYRLHHDCIEELEIIKVKEIKSLVNIEEKVNYDLLFLNAFRKLQEYGLIPITK